jgi:hypothetical protein
VGFHDNDQVISLISTHPDCIFTKVDEASARDLKDTAMLTTLHTSFEKRRAYVKPKIASDTLFGINHYAGEVPGVPFPIPYFPSRELHVLHPPARLSARRARLPVPSSPASSHRRQIAHHALGSLGPIHHRWFRGNE